MGRRGRGRVRRRHIAKRRRSGVSLPRRGRAEEAPGRPLEPRHRGVWKGRRRFEAAAASKTLRRARRRALGHLHKGLARFGARPAHRHVDGRRPRPSGRRPRRARRRRGALCAHPPKRHRRRPDIRRARSARLLRRGPLGQGRPRQSRRREAPRGARALVHVDARRPRFDATRPLVRAAADAQRRRRGRAPHEPPRRCRGPLRRVASEARDVPRPRQVVQIQLKCS
mmetsp:Transcript_23358/g.78869  ORF Transcript_23358/g.78869 Transcript_23358/m.78869 type:complete len:226 (+) Transcript_23358:1297-1974(+)